MLQPLVRNFFIKKMSINIVHYKKTASLWKATKQKMIIDARENK